MNRIALTDGSGIWFDAEQADKYQENTHWDGSNHISDATGSQWEHEKLFRTKGGKWVLNHWSQYQGSTETYEEILASEAAAWLVRNDQEAPEVSDEIAALELL